MIGQKDPADGVLRSTQSKVSESRRCLRVQWPGNLISLSNSPMKLSVSSRPHLFIINVILENSLSSAICG